MVATCTDDGPDDVVDDDANEDYGQLSKKESKQQVIIQFPWDHGGSKLLHRLGGKPKLKKGGMSGTTAYCLVGPRQPKTDSHALDTKGAG